MPISLSPISLRLLSKPPATLQPTLPPSTCGTTTNNRRWCSFSPSTAKTQTHNTSLVSYLNQPTAPLILKNRISQLTYALLPSSQTADDVTSPALKFGGCHPWPLLSLSLTLGRSPHSLSRLNRLPKCRHLTTSRNHCNPMSDATSGNYFGQSQTQYLSQTQNQCYHSEICVVRVHPQKYGILLLSSPI